MKTKNNLLLATTALVTLTALTLPGCSENEVTDINPDANPAMSFDVYTGVQTKGKETTTTTIQTTDAGFGVLAYKTSSSGWSSDGSSATPGFMYNAQVSYSQSAWGYTPIKFWPTNEDKITFFAYAPYESAPDAGTSKKIKLSGAEATGEPTIEFEVNTAELTNMVDLVTSHDNKDKVSTTNSGSVSFSFSHVLTKVVLKAKTDVDLGTDTKVFITGVKVTPKTDKLCSKATYKFADDTWDYTTSTPTYFSSDINLHNESTGVLNLTAATSSWGYTTKSIDVNSTSGAELFKADEALYFIPVSNTTGLAQAGDVQLKVSYDIVTKASDDSHTTSSVADKVIDLPQAALKKGNSYTYTLIIGMNAIKLEGTVNSDWTDATGDINMK